MDWNQLQDSLASKPGRPNASKLSWKQVNEIREKYQTGDARLVDLAQQYNVNSSTILRIVRHVYWQG
jgi:hypothetical protein